MEKMIEEISKQFNDEALAKKKKLENKSPTLISPPKLTECSINPSKPQATLKLVKQSQFSSPKEHYEGGCEDLLTRIQYLNSKIEVSLFLIKNTKNLVSEYK